ncbi:MAG: dTMP kinase [Micavibrio sp.]
MPTPGTFITLEGGEGSGKSTQIRRLSDVLIKRGHDVVITREPGGTPEAEKIRNLLVHRDGGAWTPMTECLLLFAARLMHVETLIKPALAAGKIVISDRFTDSTRAYQAYGHGLGLKAIEDLNALVLGDFKPDVTFILDVEVEEGLARAGKRLARDSSGEDRYEQLGLEFHQRLRTGYLEIAGREPERCHVINAMRGLDDVAADLERLTLAVVT